MILTPGKRPGSAELRAIPEPLIVKPQYVQVEVCNLKRPNPSIKSTKWVAIRQAPNRAKQSDSDEVILLGERGEFLEGLSSNFAALESVASGETRLITAPVDRVLDGTILELVKEVVKDMCNIRIVEECPKVQNLSMYRAIFISSTSRAVLPVNKIILADGTCHNVPSSSDPILRRIIQAVERLQIGRSIELSQ